AKYVFTHAYLTPGVSAIRVGVIFGFMFGGFLL
ncbi:hypothetical protein M2933_16195, partial [Klebsiella pneumoniae]